MRRSTVIAIVMLVCAALGAWIVADNRLFGFFIGGACGFVLCIALISFRTGADESDELIPRG